MLLATMLLEVVDGRIWASNHLECASTRVENIFPINGPAMSTCRPSYVSNVSNDHGVIGHLIGHIGDTGGVVNLILPDTCGNV